VISQCLCLNLHPSRSRDERCSLELCCAACWLHVRDMLIGWVMSVKKCRAGRSWRAAQNLEVTFGLASLSIHNAKGQGQIQIPTLHTTGGISQIVTYFSTSYPVQY
jgi:hypothetical protein